MLKHRLASLTVAAIMIGSAPVLTSLAAVSASAATTAVAVSSHSTAAANTACVYIQEAQASSFEIEGEGVNNPVRLTPNPGSCFTLHNKFTTPCGASVCTGYQYQDLSGHCLWDNGGTIDVGAACGGAGHINEDFYGISYLSSCHGWQVSDIGEDGLYMTAYGYSGSEVNMTSSSTHACWNFPS
jgi:hypothetical protein